MDGDWVTFLCSWTSELQCGYSTWFPILLLGNLMIYDLSTVSCLQVQVLTCSNSFLIHWLISEALWVTLPCCAVSSSSTYPMVCTCVNKIIQLKTLFTCVCSLLDCENCKTRDLISVFLIISLSKQMSNRKSISKENIWNIITNIEM